MSILVTIGQAIALGSKRYVFPHGNDVPFCMDFGWWSGVPSDRIFYLPHPDEVVGGRVTMVASGYGVKGDYGSGAIMVKPDDVPEPLP